MSRLKMEAALTSLTGSLGLAATLLYFAAAAATFTSLADPWRDDFVLAAIPLVLVPNTLLLLHLYMRTQLSASYLAAGLIDETLSYTEERMRSSFLRSRREALLHAMVRIRALLSIAEIEEASRVVESRRDKIKADAERCEFLLLEAELALRQDDLVTASTLLEESAALAKSAGRIRKPLLAEIAAARAELAVRAGRQSHADELLDSATWSDPDSPRLAWSKALAAARFGDADDRLAALGYLERAATSLVPASARLALRVRILRSLGRDEEADETLDQAGSQPQDPSSERMIAALVPDVRQES